MKAQVLLPKVFNFPFTYNSKIKVKIGSLVEVPFGSKREIGVVWKNNHIWNNMGFISPYVRWAKTLSLG